MLLKNVGSSTRLYWHILLGLALMMGVLWSHHTVRLAWRRLAMGLLVLLMLVHVWGLLDLVGIYNEVATVLAVAVGLLDHREPVLDRLDVDWLLLLGGTGLLVLGCGL